MEKLAQMFSGICNIRPSVGKGKQHRNPEFHNIQIHIIYIEPLDYVLSNVCLNNYQNFFKKNL
jgi:hypothetical protein